MPDSEILSGWKQIVGYLAEVGMSCDVKTARRWRDGRHLPVHSKENSGGRKQTVWALKAEIDEWRLPTIQTAILAGGKLTAVDGSGAIVWTQSLTEPISPFPPGETTWRIILVDLQGAGRPGVLVTSTITLPGFANLDHDQISYFGPTGKCEWSYTVNPDLQDCVGRPFEKLWSVRDVIIAPDKTGMLVWAAIANRERFAGCVLRLDRSGQPQVVFANAGNVERVGCIRRPEGNLIVLAGENNAYSSACAASFYADGPPCCSPPGGHARYVYANSPPGKPERYVLFPKTELIKARNKPYGHAVGLHSYQDLVTIHIETGGEGASLIYHFDVNLRPILVWTSGSHDEWHDRFWRETEPNCPRLDHPLDQCPEIRKPLVLKTWEPLTGWQEEEVPWRLPQNLL